MSSGNYESKILDAIQRIVDNAVSKANYDKTIKGIISKCADEETGKYVVKYQDSSLYAYATDLNTSYSAGEMVYVLIPGNDMTQMKTIIGSVDKLGTNYLNVIDSTTEYEVIGNNITSDGATAISLCSYTPNGDALVLYDKTNPSAALINIDATAATTYLKQSKYLICGASFQTALDDVQRYKGDYGIAFDLDFLDNNTGETVVRTYLVNVNQMKGNPYNYLTPSEQLVAFDIDGENFQRINKISVYCYDFPNEDGNITTKDIFISGVTLEAAEHLKEEELQGNYLKLITPQGIYFNNNDADTSSRVITAEVSIDNTTINANSSRLEYYWFKENNQISTQSTLYNRHGGLGWECLNDYTEITEEETTYIDWKNATENLVIQKSNNPAKENTYKCVVIYNNSIVLSKEITIFNYSSAFDITITSDSGTYFSYDVGNPTLTCYVNGSVPTDTQSVTWTYAWMVKDNNNIDSLLTETTSDNTAYNNAIAAYNELKTGLENGTILLTQETQEQLVSLANTISGYDSIMRVEANNIYKVKLNTITNFSTYTCFVYRNNIFVGKASITITNDLAKNRNAYTLVINNGNQVFKYNENGIAPTSKSLDKVQELYPLSFTLFDDAGKEIDNNAIKARDVEWTVPTTNTLINISPTHGNPSSVDTINETATYKNYKELYFTIANIYNANKDRNTIQLKVKYKDRVVVTKTDLLFMKEGEVGTNGTDFVCRIVPNAIDNIIPKYPTVIYNKNAAISATNPRLNFTPASESLWFKAELWHDGIKIFDGVTTGQSGESKQVKVEWEILKNKYTSNVIDVSNFIVNKTTGAFEFNNLSAISDTTLKANPANIVKCTLTYDDIEYYATMPITLVTTTAAKYRAELEELSGFRYVMYTTDGAKPIYDSANPFALRIYQTDNNIEQDISQTILSDYSVDYTWSVKGLSYGASSWNSEANLIEKTLYSDTLEKNQKRFIPVDTCNGYAVNNALYCSITRDGTELMNIHIPIHLYLNKYGNAALNGWDGNHIEINEDGGFILAPQIGAGKKNQDNSFTGVFMGSVKEAGKSKEEYGLYGYNAGERTIALNAEDGSARFGKAGMGQIVLDPTDNTATLKSGGYVAPVLDEHGNVITPGQGLEIDLTDPHITFGSGNFRVDSDGQVYATGFATIAALNAGDIDIPGTENFKLEYATDTVQIETDANLDPIETTVTKTITCRCLYKNSYTSDYTVNLIDENGNVITHNANSDGIGVNVSKSGNVATITFTALKDRQISHAVNSYLFRFTYTQKANTKIDKTFNANLVIQGKDGERGATGPVGPAGRDGTSVTVKGSYNSLSDLTTAASTGVITPVAGDGYIIGNDLYVFTNGAGGGGSQAGDWTDVGQFKGDDAKNCVIAASAQVFKSTDGTNYTPNNITLTPYLWAVTFDKWQYVINNGTPQDLNGTLPTGISINSTTKVLTITKDCALFNNSSAITFKCLTDDNNVYDTATIIKVTDGIDGEDGSDGESAYNVILTNEAQTIAGDNTKALATTITTGVIGYLGSTKKNTSIGTISGLPTGITATITNNNTQNTTITFNVTTSLTTKNGQITIPVTIDSTTINKIFSFSLALKGSDGKGITKVTNYYATSNNGSVAPTGSAWKTDISQLTPLSASNKYLWNYESVAYTSGDPVETDPAVIGVYGDTGLSSTDGMPNIPPIRRWTFDKVAVKVINNEAKNCYLENSNDAYNFIQQGSSQIINQYSMAVFDGTQVVRTDSSNINFNNNVSISFWLNPGNVNTTQTILQNRVNTSQGLSVFLLNKQLRLDIGGTSNTFDYYFNANTNYHVVVTYNKTNGQKKLYVNGKLKQTITINHVDQTFTNYLWIGKSSTNGTSFNSNVFVGTLDDLRIYDYILGLDNVDFLYRSNGQEAANGDNGRGLSSVVEYYLAYNSNKGVTKGTSGWTTSIQTVTSSNKYLWNYERINYTDGSWSETNPVIIGTYGDKGDKGDTGDSAVNILLTNEAQVIAGDTSKAIATEITTDVLGFIGSTQVATTVTAADISGLPTGMTATVSNHDNISTITFNVTTSMTNNSGQVTIPVKVTVNNVEMTINKIFSYSLSLKGATGGAGAAASMVDISATSQVFKSLDGGTTYSPNEITLTPRFQTVSYQDDSSHGWFYSTNGGTSWTKVSSGTNGLTISGNNLKISKTSALFSSSITSIVFKCISSNTSVFDTITIVRLSDGTNGNDAYTVVLSNESHTFPATNSAAITSSVDVDVIAYKGATSVTPTIGEITGQVAGLTTSVSGTTITVSASTSLETQSGVLNIPVTVDGKSFTKKFSWSLAKAGANGTSPTAYSLIVSHAAISKTTSGTYSPASITLTAKSQTGNAAISNFTTGRYAIFLNGSSTATTTVASTANYSYAIPADTTSIRIALYNSSTGTTILDEQTIPVVLDGINGTSPFISYLTNETQSFVYAKAVSIETSLYGYQGTTEKTVQIKTINGVTAATTDTATGKTGMNFKVSSTSAVTHPKITFTTTTSLPQGASEKLAIVYRVTGESSDRTIYFTYSTTTRGAAGTNASLVDISASSQIFKSTDGGINFAPNNITLTPRFQTVTYSKWQYTIDGGSNWTDVTSGSHGLTISGNNLTISKDSDLYTENLTAIPFKCVSSNSSIYDVMTIAKLYDVGDFEIGGKNLLLKAQVKIYGSGASGESLDNSNYLYDGSLIYTRPAVSNQGFYVTQYNLMEPDTDYLVSFKAKVTNGTVNQFYMFGTSPNNIASSYLIVDDVKKSTNAKDTSITVDLSDGKYHNFIWGFRTSATITTGNYTGNILQWNKTNATAFTIELKGLKWERGSKPTDWSPAPEDINANITAAQTTANSAQTLATQVQTDLANLSIGGRNLVLGTNTSVTATGTGGTNQCKNLYKFSQYYLNNYYPKTATAGESLQVTISYDWTSTATSGTFKNQLNGYPYAGAGIPAVTLSESNTSGHFSYIWTLSKGTNATSYTHIAVRFDNLTGDVTFSNLKIEVGNKETDWSAAPEDTTTYVDNLVSDLQDQVDGKIQTYSQNSDPSTNWDATEKTKHVGDLWCNTSTSSKITKRWSGSAWTDIGTADAKAASELASKKAQIFTGTPTIPYYVGDLWITGTGKSGIVKTCRTERTSGSYNSNDWTEDLKYTDDTAVENLKIGGTNLVSNRVENWVSGNWSIPAVGEKPVLQSSNTRISLKEKLPITPNTEYWVKKYSDKDISILFRVLDADGNFIQTASEMKNQKWTSPSTAYYVNVTVYENSTIDDIAYGVTKLKIEEGNKPTGWSLSPEDVNNIEVGGRNLLIGASKFTSNSPWVVTTTKKDGYVYNDNIYTNFQVKAGEEYVVQAKTDGIWSPTHVTTGQSSDLVTLWMVANDTPRGHSTNMVQTRFLANTSNYLGNGKWKWIVPSNFNNKYLVVRVNNYNEDGTTSVTHNFWDFKLERGSKATDWTPAPEDINQELESLNNKISDYIVGTQTTTTRFWTGVSSLDTITDGSQIQYWLPYKTVAEDAGNRVTGVDMRVDSSTTKTAGTQISTFEAATVSNDWLNLTLADGSTTGWIPCYYGGTSRLTTHYGAGNSIRLTYKVNANIAGVTYTGWFADANYNTNDNTYDRIRFNNSIKAKTAITASTFIVADSGGYFKLVAGSVFDLDKPVLWAASAINANATGTNNYLSMPTCTVRNNTNSSWTATQYETLYLVGTMNGNKFTADSTTPFTTTKPTTEDGKIYMQFGYMYSTYQCYLYPEHPLFKYVNGKFKSLDQVAYEAQSDIDNLEVGGRNYLSGYIDANGTSSITKTKWTLNGYEVDQTAPSGYRMSYSLTDNANNAGVYIGSIRTNYLSKLGIVDGDQITVSFYIKSDSTTINQKNGGYLECLVNKKDIETPVISTEWQRCSWTGVYSSTTQYQALYIIQSQKWTSMAVGEHIYISSIKIEKGTKPTDWTRSQEDVSNAIGQAVKSITELYYLHTSASTAPATPTEHVTSTSTSAGVWTTKCPTWASGKYYWTCSEILYASGAYAWTTPLVVNGLNSANATANTANTTANTANNKINNLKVGGTNILKNSNASFINTNGALYFWTKESTTTISQYTSDSTYNPCFKINVTTAGNRAYQNVTNVWKNGKIYTVSGFVKASAAGQIQFSRSGEDYSTGIDATTSWTYFSTTITSAKTTDTGTLSVHCKTANVDFYLANLKFEEGNTPTAWSPSPLDEMSSVDVEYYLSTSNSTVTGGNWSSTAPAWSSGKYLWTRNKITWKNTAITYTNAVLEKVINNANELGATANNKIDNMEIGGTNLLILSKSLAPKSNNGITISAPDKDGWFTVSGTRTGTSLFTLDLWNTTGLPSELAQYTLSIETQGTPFAAGTTYSDSSHIVLYCTGSSPNYRVGGYTTKNYTTFTTTKALDRLAYYIGASVPENTTVNGKFRIKLEKGNMPTDWSSSSEDSIAYVDETYAQIGGRNLLLDSNKETPNPNKYLISSYDISNYGKPSEDDDTWKPLATGDTYTITLNFTNSAERKGIACYVGGGNYQIGQWKAISAAGTYTYSWTFNITEDMHNASPYINVYCSTTGGGQGSTAIAGTCYANWIKLEKGNRSSAWSLAPEDMALRDAAISTVDIYYAVNGSADTPPAYSDPSWSTEVSSSIAKGLYLWSYVETTMANGEVIKSTPICLTSKPQILNGVTTQYAVYTSNTTPPSQSSSLWTSTRPNWTGQNDKYLWVRTEYSYSNPTELQYSTPTFDSSWSDMFNINKSIEDTNNNIMDYLQDGFVRVEKGAIYIMNQPSYSQSTQAILLGQAGITFQSRSNTSANWTSKTAWGIDGTFDASLINVINLTANQIQNGILKLGNENGNGTFELYNTNKKIIVQANQNGLIVNLTNGGTIKLDAENGFRVLDSKGNVSYGRENNNNTEVLFAKNEKVSESLIIGNVKIIPISGNGIGFIAAS